MKNPKNNNLKKKKEKKQYYEVKRLQAFRHFMSAHFEEIYYGNSIDELLIKRIVN
jgi:hypothetical protein